MKKKILAALVFSVTMCAFAEWSQVAAQAELDAALSLWGNNPTSLVNAIDSAYGSAYNCQAQDLFLRNWFCSILDSPIMANATMSESNTWLQVKVHAVLELGRSCSVKNDTNCWYAAAREYARVRQADTHDWYKLAGNGQNVAGVFTDGVVILNSPFAVGDTSEAANIYRQRQVDAYNLKKRFGRARSVISQSLRNVASSEALAAFPIQERNAIVSNIVELARLTTDEAAELGLTNVVETVGE